METWVIRIYSTDHSSYDGAPDKVEEYRIPAAGLATAIDLTETIVRNFSYTGNMNKLVIEKESKE